MQKKIRVLFVCLGNICRSPAAEGALKNLVAQKNLQHLFHIDSCGTAAYHIGELPNANTRKIAKGKGITLDHRARQFEKADFDNFDYILAMDQSNYNDVLALATSQEHKQKVFKFRHFDQQHQNMDVPDPYFGGLDGFVEVQEIVERTSQGFLQHIHAKQEL